MPDSTLGHIAHHLSGDRTRPRTHEDAELEADLEDYSYRQLKAKRFSWLLDSSFADPELERTFASTRRKCRDRYRNMHANSRP